MEQILIRNLPAGTKAALRVRAERHHHSVEAEARAILAAGVSGEALTIVDLLADDSPGGDFDFEPERLPLTARTPEL
jgi:plasmid stability protein